MITIALIGLLLVGVISVLPEKICFFSSCLYFTPLHMLKNTIVYFGNVLLYFAIIISYIILIVKTTLFIKNNIAFRNAIKFLITFDTKHYNNLIKSLT